jgi:ABC-type nitrate/sulfonate/bicarbonate transport system permease component
MAATQAGGQATALEPRPGARPRAGGAGAWFSRRRGPVLSVALVVVVIAAWQLFASQGWVNRVYTSEPSTIASAAWHYLPSSQGLADLGTSLEELAIGFALSITVGVTLGLLMGRYRLFEETTSLGLNIFYSLPLIALAPIIVLWFGIGIESKIVVVFLASLFPILVSTLTGVKNVDSTIRDMARSYRAKERQLWLTILLPASVPSILSGIRIGMAGALVGVVVGEFISSSEGIGFLISQSANNFNITDVFVGLLVLAVISLILTVILRKLDSHFSKWRTR